MSSILEHVNLRDAGAVVAALEAGARACLATSGRRGSTEWVEVDPCVRGTPAGTLIATGDLHDNPLHLARLVRAAGIDEAWERREGGKEESRFGEPGYPAPSHLTLHELIHGDRLMNGLDYSYRLLVRVAVMKAVFPERVHVLLANHEIAQLTGSPVAKDGVRCNEAFDEALDVAFGDDAERVRGAVREFLRALPLAVRFRCTDVAGDVLCAHSMPGVELMSEFDFGVLDRELRDEDLRGRTGPARAMTWGRNHTPEQIEELAQRFGARLFILGHEKAEHGWTVVSPQALVLNSDHEHGVYAKVDLTRARSAAEVAATCVRLSDS